MISVKKTLTLESLENKIREDQPENPCSIVIIRIGDLAGRSAPESDESHHKTDYRDRMILLPDLYDLEPFSGPEASLNLEIELYQMEPNIEN